MEVESEPPETAGVNGGCPGSALVERLLMRLPGGPGPSVLLRAVGYCHRLVSTV
jgi:hypothetical protein